VLGTWLILGNIFAGWLYLLLDPDMMNRLRCPCAQIFHRAVTNISHPRKPINPVVIGWFSLAKATEPPADP
jgi:hypothetical protein